MKTKRRYWHETGERPGWVLILAPLVLGFGLSLALAYQAWDAGRRHGATARAIVREQAEFAAWLIASDVDRRMSEALLYGFYPIDLAFGREAPDAAPGPSALIADREVSRCDDEYESGSPRVFFRYDPGSRVVEMAGRTGVSLASEIREAIEAALALHPEPGVRTIPARLGGRASPLAYRRWGGDGRDVVYGFESCWNTASGNVFEEAIAATQALPPRLVGDTPNDSLFRVAARLPGGKPVFGERTEGAGNPDPEAAAAPTFYGSVEVGDEGDYGGLRLRVTLLPEVAERLVAGGVPPSRLPIALGLLTVTGLLMWVAVRQLRRGHALVSLRGDFVRNVSHELRTPLQQILLFTELLRSGRLPPGEKRDEALAIMHAETRRLIELVRNVLHFSNGAAPVRVSAVALDAVVRETAEAFRPLAAGRGTAIEVEVERPATVAADPDGLKRVLINLLDNAVKYGPEGQTVRVDVRPNGDWGEVAISDRGPGVPPEDRARIWEPFGRLDRDEMGATAGSGIGLTIVRRIVDEMGGRVEVTDASPSGARFIVRLPLRDTAT